jgi:hypothetical protein
VRDRYEVVQRPGDLELFGDVNALEIGSLAMLTRPTPREPDQPGWLDGPQPGRQTGSAAEGLLHPVEPA